MPRLERRLLRAAFDQPSCNQGPPQRVNECRHCPHVIGQFLALVAEGLSLGLRRRIGDGEPGDPTG